MKGQFDVIFCRNVVIYFDLETKNKLFSRYAELLRPNGYLILGHSETMSREVKEFTSVGRNYLSEGVRMHDLEFKPVFPRI